MRLLIAEDCKPLRTFAERYFKQLDYEVVAVEDGVDAVGLFKAGEEFDYVISDFQMPRVMGDELLAWLMGNRPHMVDKFLICTGGSMRQKPVSIIRFRY